MSQAIPRTIPEYLDQLRSALRGADPAMIQDALYDAEEHLRAELAEHPGLDEATMLEKVATSYGAPDEVAEIYRVKEGEVEQALRPRRRQPVAEKSVLAKFFGVAVDPRAYLALFYMVLTLATGIFYFTWVVTGLSMSAGFAILIIGIPFIILFFAALMAWMLTNTLLLRQTAFDPYPYILLNLCLSCLASIQAPIIMMSQNRQEAKDRLRSEQDYVTNLKAELEIRSLTLKIDQLLTQQWQHLVEIQQIQTDILREMSARLP